MRNRSNHPASELDNETMGCLGRRKEKGMRSEAKTDNAKRALCLPMMSMERMMSVETSTRRQC